MVSDMTKTKTANLLGPLLTMCLPDVISLRPIALTAVPFDRNTVVVTNYYELIKNVTNTSYIFEVPY